MSRPRKTWRESAEMISTGRPVSAASASARRIASSVLPVAVAPPMTMRGGRGHAPTGVPRNAYGPAWSMRTGTSAPDEVVAAGQVDELVLRASGPRRERPRYPSRATPRPHPRRARATAAWPRYPRGPRPRARPTRRSARARSASWSASSSLSRSRFTAGGDVVGELRGRRPRPRRVHRREDLVVAHGLEQGQRRAELLVGLAAEPDDDVGRDRDPGHRLADPGEALLVVLDRVLAAHPPEHGVVAGLDRQVEVLADARALGQRGDEPA